MYWFLQFINTVLPENLSSCSRVRNSVDCDHFPLMSSFAMNFHSSSKWAIPRSHVADVKSTDVFFADMLSYVIVCFCSPVDVCLLVSVQNYLLVEIVTFAVSFMTLVIPVYGNPYITLWTTLSIDIIDIIMLDKIRYPMRPLYGDLTGPYVQVQVTSRVVVAHRYTMSFLAAEPRTITGLLLAYQFLCWTILVTPYSMVWDWRVLSPLTSGFFSMLLPRAGVKHPTGERWNIWCICRW